MWNLSSTAFACWPICIFGNVAITFKTCPLLCSPLAFLSKSDDTERSLTLNNYGVFLITAETLGQGLAKDNSLTPEIWRRRSPKRAKFGHIWSLSCSSLASIRLSLALLSSSTASALSFSQCLQYWLLTWIFCFSKLGWKSYSPELCDTFWPLLFPYPHLNLIQACQIYLQNVK